MYTQIALTLLLIILLWIAVSLQIITSSLRIVRALMRFPKHVFALERKELPLVKFVATKVAISFVIRYFSKKIL